MQRSQFSQEVKFIQMLQVYIDAKPLEPGKLFNLLCQTRKRIPFILVLKKKPHLQRQEVNNTEQMLEKSP